jgi:hypothetical protein
MAQFLHSRLNEFSLQRQTFVIVTTVRWKQFSASLNATYRIANYEKHSKWKSLVLPVASDIDGTWNIICKNTPENSTSS